MILNRKKTWLKTIILTAAAAVLLVLSACSQTGTAPSPSDPHEGMVEVPDGIGGTMWVQLYENIPASSLQKDWFYSEDGILKCSAEEFEVRNGIDVSFHQGDIDWDAAAESGVDFAMIRCGYRGTTEGGLYTDELFESNMRGALAAGLDVGVYFFSQAVSVSEAMEEADYVAELISGYDITLPVMFDWERQLAEQKARTASVDGATLTDCCTAFCDMISAEGYEPGVYFYPNLGYFEYELDRLENLVFWVSDPGDTPDFYYEHYIWQYSHTGTVDGIDGDVDMNLLFVRSGNKQDENYPG